MKYQLFKNKKLAIFGLIYLIIAVIFFSITENIKAHIVPGSFDFSKFLLMLNIILLPSWILFLVSLNLSKKNRWKYRK